MEGRRAENLSFSAVPLSLCMVQCTASKPQSNVLEQSIICHIRNFSTNMHAFNAFNKKGALLSPASSLQGPKCYVGRRRAQARLPPPQAMELASVCEQSFQIPAAAALVLPVMGLAGYKLSLYSQKEVINARMLGNFIPEGARNIIQMNGSTRDIFYYPKSTIQIVVYGNNLKPGLFERAGMQAQIPTVSFKKPASSLDAVPSNSVDGIACLGGISETEAGSKKRVITEALRVLKTGAPFIFIEPLADGASPLRPLFSGNGSKAIGMYLPGARGPFFALLIRSGN
ncbi:hypothetical protein DUNSADRAFT_3878 [Dunaliella salina]|uniref:Methyltransferase type 11 domain-containing protein n=1 Tax=Dunaliella salina TaxID=3046 RepID=A0ABQ7FV46_DUNSA|nr:hypothetical protein DUNSADRAFT_3878 [Dunaliella salina]|eukprot:KAF5826260.1 hypothetical protein DUNSADRAFT_3878 [Dunaliella salina]